MGKKKQKHDLFDGESIQKKILKRYSFQVIAIWFIWVVCFVISIFFQLDVERRMAFFEFIKNMLEKFNSEFALALPAVKLKVKAGMEAHIGVILTSHTILAAIVTFVYSIMENRKEGISHRRIMSYTFGTWLIPSLYAISTLEVFIIYISNTMLWNAITFSNIVFSYLVQALCIWLCLYSSSYTYAVRAICKVEWRQYKFISKHSTVLDMNCLDDKALKNNQKLWVFLMRHMVQAVKSDDLMDDKMLLVQKLIRVPFYKKRQWLHFYTEINQQRLMYVNSERVYEYYYNNILAMLATLKDSSFTEERLKVYTIIYDFLDDLSQKYNSLNFSYNGLEQNYIMTVSAIVNAVQYSNLPESESVCTNVFCECMKDISKHMMGMQLGLFILYQEFLYRTNNEAFRVSAIDNIINSYQRNKFEFKEPEAYGLYWFVWCKYGSTLSYESCCKYFCGAYMTMVGKSTESLPISYIMQRIKKRKD